MNRLFKSGYLLGIYLFLYLPLLMLMAHSFNASKYGTSWTGFTFDWYSKLIHHPTLADAALNSLLIALLSATLATMLGTLGAVSIYRYRYAGRKVYQGMLFVTMMAPDIVMAISLLTLFLVLHLTLGFWSLLFSHITLCLPFVVVTVLARLKGFDPRLLEAAQDLGAGEWRTFSRVILPLALPAVAAGWLLAFTLSLDDVIISFFVSGPTFEILPLRIYSMVRLGVKPEVNALATLLFVVPLILVTLAHFLMREKKR